jgi:hypothetical protein
MSKKSHETTWATKISADTKDIIFQVPPPHPFYFMTGPLVPPLVGNDIFKVFSTYFVRPFHSILSLYDFGVYDYMLS